MPTAQTNKTRDSILESIKTLEVKFREVYDKFSEDVSKHLDSKHSIPSVTREIARDDISSAQAMKTLVEASYEGQKLTNLYLVIYATRMNDIYHDAKLLTQTLYNTFMQDVQIQDIKTSAEKERQYSSFAFSVNTVWDKINKMNENQFSLGDYVKSIMFSLGRMQNMIDSLERLRAKALWVDSESQSKAMNILSDNNEEAEDLKVDDFDEDWE